MCQNRIIVVASNRIAAFLTACLMLCSLSYVAGCAFSNVGAVDMRRTASVKSIKKDDTADKKKVVPEPKPTPPDAEHLPLTIKNFSLGEPKQLEKGDSLCVTLRTAFIHGFTESSLNPLQRFRPKAEIAIVVNAFESETGKEIDFVNMQSGRLVFFSDDVHSGQLLNFNNLPVYGPKSYGGQPFALRITIFELDGGTEQTKTLLNSVAKAGSAAYAPASPVLNLLNGIGQSLFGGSHDDTQFRYTMQLNPRPGDEFNNSFLLESGNYVFVRLEDRTQKVPWDEIELNENKGELFWIENDDDGSKQRPYTSHTYLVLEISTGGSAKDIDLSQNTYEKLLAALAKEDKAAAERLTGFTKSYESTINQVILDRNQTTNFDMAKQALAVIENDRTSEFEKREAAEKIIKLLAGSLKEDGKLREFDTEKFEGPLLTDEQVDYVISKLRHSVDTKTEGISRNEYDMLSRKSIGKVANEGKGEDKIVDLIAPLSSS